MKNNKHNKIPVNQSHNKVKQTKHTDTKLFAQFSFKIIIYSKTDDAKSPI